MSSMSSLTTNRSLGFGRKSVPNSGKSEFGWRCGPRGSIEEYKGMLTKWEERLVVITSCVWFHLCPPYKLLHASWV